MKLGNAKTDSNGRIIGHDAAARCSQDGCFKMVRRTFFYKCAGPCGGYFCGRHLEESEYFYELACRECVNDAYLEVSGKDE